MCGCAGKTVKSLENMCHTPERFYGGEEALYQVCAPYLTLPYLWSDRRSDSDADS